MKTFIKVITVCIVFFVVIVGCFKLSYMYYLKNEIPQSPNHTSEWYIDYLSKHLSGIDISPAYTASKTNDVCIFTVYSVEYPQISQKLNVCDIDVLNEEYPKYVVNKQEIENRLNIVVNNLRFSEYVYHDVHNLLKEYISNENSYYFSLQYSNMISNGKKEINIVNDIGKFIYSNDFSGSLSMNLMIQSQNGDKDVSRKLIDSLFDRLVIIGSTFEGDKISMQSVVVTSLHDYFEYQLPDVFADEKSNLYSNIYRKVYQNR